MEQVLALWRNDRQAIADRRENRPLAGLVLLDSSRRARRTPDQVENPGNAARNPSVPAAAPPAPDALRAAPSAKGLIDAHPGHHDQAGRQALPRIMAFDAVAKATRVVRSGCIGAAQERPVGRHLPAIGLAQPRGPQHQPTVAIDQRKNIPLADLEMAQRVGPFLGRYRKRHQPAKRPRDTPRAPPGRSTCCSGAPARGC